MLDILGWFLEIPYNWWSLFAVQQPWVCHTFQEKTAQLFIYDRFSFWIAFQIAILLIKMWPSPSALSAYSRMDIFHGVFTLFSWLSWKTTHISARCRYWVSLCYFNRISRASFNDGGGEGWSSPHTFYFCMHLHFKTTLSLHQICETGGSSAPKPKYSCQKFEIQSLPRLFVQQYLLVKLKKIPLLGLTMAR